MQPRTMEESISSDPDTSSTTHNDKRKSSKPVMEKKRRARINNSLNELKEILLEALKKDSTRHSKLEKADILEMTVKYLKNVERQRLSVALSIDPTVVDKYKSGFNGCRNEVMRFLSTCEGVNVDVRTRLLNHLALCHQSLQGVNNSYSGDVFGEFNPNMPSSSTFNLPPEQKSSQIKVSTVNVDTTSRTFQMQLPMQNSSVQLPTMPQTTLALAASQPILQSNSQCATVTPLLVKGNLQITSKQIPAPLSNHGSAARSGNITVIMPATQGGQTTAYLTPTAINNQFQTVELVAAQPVEINYNSSEVLATNLQPQQNTYLLSNRNTVSSDKLFSPNEDVESKSPERVKESPKSEEKVVKANKRQKATKRKNKSTKSTTKSIKQKRVRYKSETSQDFSLQSSKFVPIEAKQTIIKNDTTLYKHENVNDVSNSFSSNQKINSPQRENIPNLSKMTTENPNINLCKPESKTKESTHSEIELKRLNVCSQQREKMAENLRQNEDIRKISPWRPWSFSEENDSSFVSSCSDET